MGRFITVILISIIVMASESTVFAEISLINSIKLSKDGSTIEILGDQPLTYVYRKMQDETGIIMDVAPARLKGIGNEIMGKGPIAGIWIKELMIEGIPVTRLAIGTTSERPVEVLRDGMNSARLFVKLQAGASPEAAVPAEPQLGELLENPSKPAEPKAESISPTPIDQPILTEIQKTDTATKVPIIIPETVVAQPNPVIIPAPIPLPEPVHPVASAETSSGSKPVIGAVTINGNEIEFIAGKSITEYDAFKLSNPERLVIDISNAVSNIKGKEFKIGRYGVKDFRVGAYPDKVRIVFDALGRDGLPLHIVQKSPKGLKVTFADVKKR
jgi:hypothetical protein